MRFPDRQSVRRMLPFAAGGSALILLLLLLLRPAARRSPDADGSGDGIPAAEPGDVPPGRSGALRGAADIEDYWDSLEGDTDGMESVADDGQQGPVTEPASPHDTPPAPAVEDLFGSWSAAPVPTARETAQGTPPPERPEPPSGDTSGPETEEAQAAPPPPVRRSGSVSSLDLDVGPEPGSGFSTLDGSDMWADSSPGRPFRCALLRGGRIRDGDRVTVRLLEDLVADGVRIPADSHLTGTASLGARLELTFPSVDLGGRIVRLGFEAWDPDGQKGIYCPETGGALRDAADRGAATAAGLLSQRLGRIAREAVSAGADLARRGSSARTVTVPAGYTFYIMKEDR